MMFKIYIKWKFIAIIQNELIHYLSEMSKYTLRGEEWKNKVWEKRDCKYMTAERFEKNKENQIKYSYDSWLMNHYKYEAVKNILEIIKDEK